MNSTVELALSASALSFVFGLSIGTAFGLRAVHTLRSDIVLMTAEARADVAYMRTAIENFLHVGGTAKAVKAAAHDLSAAASDNATAPASADAPKADDSATKASAPSSTDSAK